MRAKHSEREQAIALRQKGLSYREIRSCVPVSKSSLSLWLREVGLARRQIQRLTDKKLAAGRRGGQIVHEMRMRRLADRLRSADQEAKSLLAEGDLWWAVGVVLYWAEGGK
jgi:transposase